MIYSCAAVRHFALHRTEGDTAPPLRWAESWHASAGQAVIAGLLDTGFDELLPDLVGADVVIRNFTTTNRDSRLSEHGTASVTTLIGQGHHQIRGIAPRARLLAAQVVNADGVATPQAVAEALEWLVSSGVHIIAMPLGDSIEREGIAHQIEKISERGVVVFAAAGNGHPETVTFPARHPLVIAVGAADARGKILPECSRWPRLDLVAPGEKIPVVIRDGVIRLRRGTSIACIFAAGVAILALSAGAIPVGSISRECVLSTMKGGEGAG